MSNRLVNLTFPYGLYPQRKPVKESFLKRLVINSLHLIKNRFSINPITDKPAITQIVNKYNEYRSLSNHELQELISLYRENINQQRLTNDNIINMYALIKVMTEKQCNLILSDIHLYAAWGMLHENIMNTDIKEYRDLIPLFPAVLFAYFKIPVHIIYVNDSHTKQSFDLISNIIEQFGLHTGYVIAGSHQEYRKQAYQQDITFCSYKELVFDYLKDRLILGTHTGELQLKLEQLYVSNPRYKQLHLRGLCCALIHDANHILIEEAKMPLSVTGINKHSHDPEVYYQALRIAHKLKSGIDFNLNPPTSETILSPEGIIKVSALSKHLKSYWQSHTWRNHIIQQALAAIHCYKNNIDYAIQNKKIIQVNKEQVNKETVLPIHNAAWDTNIKQLVEAKESCEISPQLTTQARINLQRFFQQYHRLAGLTENAAIYKKEFWQIFRLQLCSLYGNHTKKTTIPKPIIMNTTVDKIKAITSRIQELSLQEHPILILAFTSNTIQALTHSLKDYDIPFQYRTSIPSHENNNVDSHQIIIITDLTHAINLIRDSKYSNHNVNIISAEYHIDDHHYNLLLQYTQHNNGTINIFTSLEDTLFLYLKDKWYFRYLLSFINPHNKFGNAIASHLPAWGSRLIRKERFLTRKSILNNEDYLEQSMAFTRTNKQL